MTELAGRRRWIEEESGVLRQLAGHHPDVVVPSCPGWDVQALLGHLGGAHRWVAQIVQSAGDPSPHQRVLPEPPPALADALDWFDDSVRIVLAAFDGCAADAVVWTPVPSGALGGRDWWARKQAVEAAVHRHDGDDAVASGGAAPIDPGLAADGIDEHLDGFAPSLALMAGGALPGVVLHLRATDGPGRWWLDLDPAGSGAGAGRGAPPEALAARTTTLSGRASDLLLWLWNRHPEPATLVASGDPAIAHAWRALAI